MKKQPRCGSKWALKPERILRFDAKTTSGRWLRPDPAVQTLRSTTTSASIRKDPNFNRADLVNGPGDTTMESWNLVFMQYNA